MKYQLSAIAVAALLTACGGGGGGTTADSATTATVAAGNTMTAVAGNTAGTLLTSIPAATYAADSAESIMFAMLNTLRKDGGFGVVPQNTLLDKAAINHANYVNRNYLDTSGLFIKTLSEIQPNGWLLAHTETLGGIGFTGVLPLDRAKAVGYSSFYIGEDLVFYHVTFPNDKTAMEQARLTAILCMEGWYGSNGHRASLLAAGAVEIGYGVATSAPYPWGNSGSIKTITCAVEPSLGANFSAMKLAPAGWTGIYPLENSTGILTTGHYGGLAASIHFDNTSTMTISSFTMKKVSDGSLVPGIIDTTIRRYQAYFTPNAPLEPLTQYEANFQGSEITTIAGRSSRNVSKVWRFTTR